MTGNMSLFDLKKQLGEDRYNDLYVRHGSCADRGSADSYYGRQFNPHYYVGATYSSDRVERDQMADDEIAAYKAGYDENEADRHFKNWD